MSLFKSRKFIASILVSGIVYPVVIMARSERRAMDEAEHIADGGDLIEIKEAV